MTDLKKHDKCPFGCGSSDAYSEKIKDGKVIGHCFSAGCGKTRTLDFNGNTQGGSGLYYSPPLSGLHKIQIKPLASSYLAEHGVWYADKYRCSETYLRYQQIVLQNYLDGEYRGCQLKNTNSNHYLKYFTLAEMPLIY